MSGIRAVYRGFVILAAVVLFFGTIAVEAGDIFQDNFEKTFVAQNPCNGEAIVFVVQVQQRLGLVGRPGDYSARLRVRLEGFGVANQSLNLYRVRDASSDSFSFLQLPIAQRSKTDFDVDGLEQAPDFTLEGISRVTIGRHLQVRVAELFGEGACQ